MEKLDPKKVDGEYRSVMQKAPPAGRKEQKINAVAEGSLHVGHSIDDLSSRTAKQEKSEGYLEKISNFFRNLLGWNKRSEPKKSWLNIFLSAFHFYGSIHKSAGSEEANLSNHNIEELNPNDKKNAALAKKVKGFFLKTVASSFARDKISKIINKMNIFETAVSNVSQHLKEKIATSEDKRKIVDNVEGFVVTNITSYFSASNASQVGGKIDEAKCLEKMSEDGRLPDAICLLTKEEIDLLDSNDPERSQIEEKMKEQEYAAVKEIATKIVEKIVFPGGVDETQLGPIKENLTEAIDKLENLLEEAKVAKKMDPTFIKGMKVKFYEKLIAEAKSYLSKTQVKEMIIDKMTRELLAQIDKLSDPEKFSSFLAQRIKPPDPNLPVAPSELEQLQSNPLFDSLFFGAAGWLHPQTEESVKRVVERAGTANQIASTALLPSYVFKTLQEKTEGTWLGGLVSTLNFVPTFVAEKAEKVDAYMKKVEKDTLAISVAPRKLQNSMNNLKQKAISQLTEENLTNKLDQFLEGGETPKEEEISLQKALKARFTSLDRFRGENKQMRSASGALGLSEEYDQIHTAINEDPDFDNFVERAVSNKRLNKVAIHQVLQGVVQGLEESEFFKRS